MLFLRPVPTRAEHRVKIAVNGWTRTEKKNRVVSRAHALLRRSAKDLNCQNMGKQQSRERSRVWIEPSVDSSVKKDDQVSRAPPRKTPRDGETTAKSISPAFFFSSSWSLFCLGHSLGAWCLGKNPRDLVAALSMLGTKGGPRGARQLKTGVPGPVWSPPVIVPQWLIFTSNSNKSCVLTNGSPPFDLPSPLALGFPNVLALVVDCRSSRATDESICRPR